VHCTKISPEFEYRGQSKVKGQGQRGQKTKKYSILFGSRPLVLVQHFFRSGPRERCPSPVQCRWENQRMLSSYTFKAYFSMGLVVAVCHLL